MKNIINDILIIITLTVLCAFCTMCTPVQNQTNTEPADTVQLYDTACFPMTVLNANNQMVHSNVTVVFKRVDGNEPKFNDKHVVRAVVCSELSYHFITLQDTDIDLVNISPGTYKAEKALMNEYGLDMCSISFE